MPEVSDNDYFGSGGLVKHRSTQHKPLPGTHTHPATHCRPDGLVARHSSRVPRSSLWLPVSVLLAILPPSWIVNNHYLSTEISNQKIIFEQIEFPAKLLESLLRRNTNNTNQTLPTTTIWLQQTLLSGCGL